MQLLSQNWGLANPQIVEVPWAANLQFFEKLFDYINYLYVRKDRICSFSWKIQSVNSSSIAIEWYFKYFDYLNKAKVLAPTKLYEAP